MRQEPMPGMLPPLGAPVAKVDLPRLREEATALLEGWAGSGSGVEDALRRAHQVICEDLITLQQAQQAGRTVDYPELFGADLNEKLAALLYVTKHKLADVAYGPAEWREIGEARRDLSLTLEILVRLHAADGLGVLYDFAAAQQEAHDLPWWTKVRLRCLHLVALMPECQLPVLAFLKDRPVARRQVEQLMRSPDPSIATALRALGEGYVRARQAGEIPAVPAPTYLAYYRQYDQGEPTERTLGLASLLAAQDRIRTAVLAGATDDLLAWMQEGSPAVAAAAFRSSRFGMTAMHYATLLEHVLHAEGMPLVRQAAAVLELGRLNRKAEVEGGEASINRLLVALALTESGAREGLARLAVSELAGVNAFNDLASIVEDAPILEVAEEAIAKLGNLRRLQLIDHTIRQLPLLQAAYQRARTEVQEARQLMEAAWSAQTDDLMEMYLDRLRAMHAYQELHQLCQKNTRVSELARVALSELRLDGQGGG